MPSKEVSTTLEFVQSLMESSIDPYYQTKYGAAYAGDSLALLRLLPEKSVGLVITSPPFGLRTKKNYGNVDAENYLDWFLPFSEEVLRVLTDDGSFVIEIGGAWMPRSPTRSIYQYELLVELIKGVGFHLAQEFFWFNPAKMPGPAQWVTIERIRCTDAVSSIWWLSKTERPAADNRQVLVPYSQSMERLLRKGYNSGKRPSGHVVSEKWQRDNGGAIPKNLLAISNTSSNDPYQRKCREQGIPLHPARFPIDLPRFFIDFLANGESPIVLDIFAGSNVTGQVAEEVERPWLAFEIVSEFLEASKFRFGLPVDISLAGGNEDQ